MKLISHESGICPYCKTEDIEYGSIELEEDHVYYPAKCNKCNKEFREYYNILYDSTWGEIKEGDKLDETV